MLKQEQVKLNLAIASKSFLNGLAFPKIDSENDEILAEAIEIDLQKNQEVQFDKTIVIASSYESKNPVEFVLTELSATSVSKIQENNTNYWKKFGQMPILLSNQTMKIYKEWSG